MSCGESIFKAGDKVTHIMSASHHQDPNYMNAVVVSTHTDREGSAKVKVKYDRNGRGGEWLAQFTVHRLEENTANFVPVSNYSHITDPVDNRSIKILNKENPVKAKITEVFENGVLVQTLINDNDVKNICAGQLLGYVTDAKTAIEKLGKHDGSKCKFLAEETGRLMKFIDAVYAILDKEHLNN